MSAAEDILTVRATPFHGRSAEFNRCNRWIARNGWTLSLSYTDVNDEALAARRSAVLADITWRWRVMLDGARAAHFLSRLATRDISAVSPGHAIKALWLCDGGGVRGAGAFARFGRDSFLLAASAPDRQWIEQAAARFDVSLRDVSEDEGGLALIGPNAAHVLKAAGLPPDIEPLQFRKLFWRDLEVTVSRFGEHGGYEIWCAADDGVLVWDRLMRAGMDYGLEPAGLAAMDILDLERGVLRPGRDFAPATAARAGDPTPLGLGMESLIDPEHIAFNGRAAWSAVRERENHVVAGIEIESDVPAPHTPLQRNGVTVGQTLSSAYSPALGRAIALARIEKSAAGAGTRLSVTLSPSASTPEFRTVRATVVDLPFLPPPDPVAA